MVFNRLYRICETIIRNEYIVLRTQIKKDTIRLNLRIY